MSVKKILILSAAVAAAMGATAALAGGPEYVPGYQPHVYVEGNVGYAWIDWRNFAFTPFLFGFNNNNNNNNQGGFAGGGDIGYMFTRNLGLEVGAYYLPRVNGNDFFFGNPLTVNNWFGYIGGRISVPIYQNIDLFGKVGAAWRSLNWTGAGAGALGLGNSTYWAPMFAVGGKYQINDNWSVNVMYTRVAGNNTFSGNNNVFGVNSRLAPPVNMVTGGIGYEFAV